jgi:hypothetical protein
MMLSVLLSMVLPHVLELVAGLLSIFFVWFWAALKRKWNLDVEARHREVLEKALITGIRSAVVRGLKKDNAVEAAMAHVRHSVPNALGKLKPDPMVLQNLAYARLADEIKAGDR